MSTTPDQYDEQIAYLKEHPDEIKLQWMAGRGLFAFAEKKGGCGWGCLTMIRKRYSDVEDRPDLTKAISEDRRIPKNLANITVKHLPRFAYWQRILDKELGRTPANPDPQ